MFKIPRNTTLFPYTFLIGITLMPLISGWISNAEGKDLPGMDIHEIKRQGTTALPPLSVGSPPTRLYLRRATGNLRINGTAPPTTDEFEAYFLIPIPFYAQVPILIDVSSPDLVDYRFLHLGPPNAIIAARLRRTANTTLDWTAWVAVKENTYADYPTFAPIPRPDQLPDSVKKWLDTTDCVQVFAPIVRHKADSVRDTTTNLIKLANDICRLCYQIPWEFPHNPFALDAVYALTWGSSCTGHAHAGAALFRANGVPARILLNMPSFTSNAFDMHWRIDYYVPDYGWVNMETSIGQNPYPGQDEIVTLACNPEDEFVSFLPYGVEGYWHTSDTVLGSWNPNWGRAHLAYNELTLADSTRRIELAHALTDSVFAFYSEYWGIRLTPAQQAIFQAAFNAQANALAALRASDLSGYITNMTQALNTYKNVNPESITTIYLEDFEGGPGGWTHGGSQDEWECGVPTFGPPKAHSGRFCWGTDLNDTYNNDADCWLQSPPINLNSYACAYLSFWPWLWTETRITEAPYRLRDPLSLEITSDGGTTFQPYCSPMGAVNSDPAIPGVGGWTRIVLDLNRYLGQTVQLRFRFQSDAQNVYAGSYIDDVHVYGRQILTGVEAKPKPILGPETIALDNTPNPFTNRTTITFSLPTESRVTLKVYDCLGRMVETLVEGLEKSGPHALRWKGQVAGVYYLRMEFFPKTGRNVILTKKLLKIT